MQSNRNQKATAVALKKEQNRMIGSNMNFAASEAYKLLRTNLMFSFSKGDDCRVIGITSSLRGEGKSMTSINLAYTIAQTRKRVLLIEGDMRMPTVAGRLGLKPSPGLSNLMAGMNTIHDVVQTCQMGPDGEDAVTFQVMVSGDIPPNPSELLGSKRMASLLNVVKGSCDYVILDLPPVTAVSDAVLVSGIVDGMVVVVRNDKTPRGALADTIRQLRQVDARIVGFVFNGATESGGSYYRSKKYYKK